MRLSMFLHYPGFHIFLLYSLTFCIVRLCFNGFLYSPLFSRSKHLKHLSQEFLSRNLQEGVDAFRYFYERALRSTPFYENQVLPTSNISALCSHKATSNLLRSQTAESVLLAITIITTRRRPEYHYPLQVAHGFLDRISECGSDCSGFRLFICNVDDSPSSHTDACLLSHFLPSVNRPFKQQEAPNRFEREKQDYAFCLSKTLETFSPKYVMLIEDDAVPQIDIFHAFFQLVNVRFPKEPLGGGLYVKLYHPERLQGYLNPEPMRILEWIGLGILSGFALTFAYTNLIHQSPFRWYLFTAFAIYAMLLAELLGRHYILELRRVLPALYNVVPASECCTPAMLFSEASAKRTLKYLDEINCKAGYAKDTALYKELGRRGEWAWVLEPNMVTHVGLFSTLRGSMEGNEPLLL
ncbi:post-GPI attachment to proteins factor 4 [Bombina bombina]|uniref:post-GPI attachment to proteins factor 4 n=1 Tax=Bombina bombina TaxID=8345 RepID=UPI00235A6F6A|nr:post-GPI attachment to proteins factor 4 [Bombina bombina]XP_053548289.1 post-GPI attachment to proteins factor 4 [Bombina bombina]